MYKYTSCKHNQPSLTMPLLTGGHNKQGTIVQAYINNSDVEDSMTFDVNISLLLGALNRNFMIISLVLDFVLYFIYIALSGCIYSTRQHHIGTVLMFFIIWFAPAGFVRLCGKYAHKLQTLNVQTLIHLCKSGVCFQKVYGARLAHFNIPLRNCLRVSTFLDYLPSMIWNGINLPDLFFHLLAIINEERFVKAWLFGSSLQVCSFQRIAGKKLRAQDWKAYLQK